ncbi:MAG: lipocalin-like domain-containing protein [Aquisalimonadaceae bacterium]
MLLLLVLLLGGCGSVDSPEPAGGEPLSITGALAGEEDIAGYARVTGPREFSFPDDHGAHPDYRHEWWYVTGNLASETGRRFGYQVTFFRFNVAPEMAERRSALATNQVWMAHLALTDPETGRFLHAERFARGAAGLAGATVRPFRVWLEDWSLSGGEGDDVMPMRFVAEEEAFALDLRLEAIKPLVLQGDRGYSRKGAGAGNASHYYSYTRLVTEGALLLDGEAYQVSGESWMDREWGTSALSEDQAGWDWFSLQLADGREIMFYRLREDGGGTDKHSRGLLVQEDGAYRPLAVDEVVLRATRHWRSPVSGARYPVAWSLAIPGERLDLRIEPVQDDQEMRSGFRYWEGAVEVSGGDGETPVAGRGYVELTGYGQ